MFVLFAAAVQQQSRQKRRQWQELDENWIAQMAAGNMQALALLYEKTNTDVYGFALSIVKNPQTAQDVMQETYLKILSAAGTYQPQGKPMAWIFTIVRNLSLTKLREGSTAQLPIDTQWDLAEDADPIQQATDRLVLQGALELLTQQEREIVMLHSVSGLKHREIAQMLALPLSTVLSKYNRALRKLQKYMEQEERR